MLKAEITNENGRFFALVLVVDGDHSHVVRGYNGRYFKTEAAANRSTALFIKKRNALMA